MFYYYCVDRMVQDYISSEGNGSVKAERYLPYRGTFCLGDGTNAAGTLTGGYGIPFMGKSWKWNVRAGKMHMQLWQGKPVKFSPAQRA